MNARDAHHSGVPFTPAQRQIALLAFTRAAQQALDGHEASARLLELCARQLSALGLQWLLDDYRAERRRRAH